jgi:2-keto-4-pentenoate hydratase/2-oxohepta-3-ene-1,7-dioic acid hydratase in catechol pathway
MDKVFAYTIFDDITGNGMRAEDLFHYYALYPSEDKPDEVEKVEQHLSYATRYKGTDNFGILGPWLVTADEIADPDNLDVTCSVNGEAIAKDNTQYYNYKVAEIISFLSNFLTLDPGDVVSMGTAFKPGSTSKSIHHTDLQKVPGPIEICIEGLGTQVTPVTLIEKELGRWKLR